MDEAVLAERLVSLCRVLGQPQRDLMILGEGNASAAAEGTRLLVKASGTQMSSMEADDVVSVDWSCILDALDQPRSDEEWKEILRTASGASVRSPSIEVPVHAVAVGVCGARWVAHTHPTPVNAVLCSESPEVLANGAVFPDQVVICGPAYCLVPYVDPGQPLGAAVRDAVESHRERLREWPRVVLLANHGMVALGDSPEEVLNVTLMMVKAARVIVGSAAVGGPRFLSDEQTRRLASREDEAMRAALLRSTPKRSP